jgi:hypothetical protein
MEERPMPDNLVEQLLRKLGAALKALPDGFYNSFDFIEGKKNLCSSD